MKKIAVCNYEKLALFTPGPTEVPQRVLDAGARYTLHHRTPAFAKELEELIEGAKNVFGTKEDVLLLHTTGRGAMEGVITNLFKEGESIISICNGNFGELFAKLGELHGLSVTRLFNKWDEMVDLNLLEETLKKNPSIKAVTTVHSDTSNGIANPVEEITALCKKYNVLSLVDTISSLGCMEFQFSQWGVDVAVTASQKGLISPPGVSLVALSAAAWEKVNSNTIKNSFTNFPTIKKFYEEKRETPGTTPVSLVLSLNEAFKIMEEEGLDNVYQRHERLSFSLKEALSALQLSTYIPWEKASRSLTAICSPQGVTPAEIIETGRELFGIQVAGGLGQLNGSIIRIGHMGLFNFREGMTAVNLLETVLFKKRLINHIGEGAEAFLKAWEGM